MNRFIKKLICGLSSAVLFFSVSANSFAFSPRTTLTQSDCELQYWQYSASGNPFSRNWDLAGGNCTWYAYGRAWELLGYKPSLSRNGAHKWYTYNDGYERGSEPRLGAIACWSDSDNTVGHVAVVEAINGDEITLSESGWSYQQSYFTTVTKNKYNLDYTLGGVTRHFQGYIYLPINIDEDESTLSAQTAQNPPIPVKPIVNINTLRSVQTYSSASGIQIFLNGIYLPLSDYSKNVNNVVLVPARDLIEAMGGSVSWSEPEKKLTANVRNSIFEAKANSRIMYINNFALEADTNVIISEDGKLLIPLRAAVTMLGGRILGVDYEMNIQIAF